MNNIVTLKGFYYSKIINATRSKRSVRVQQLKVSSREGFTCPPAGDRTLHVELNAHIWTNDLFTFYGQNHDELLAIWIYFFVCNEGINFQILFIFKYFLSAHICGSRTTMQKSTCVSLSPLFFHDSLFYLPVAIRVATEKNLMGKLNSF